MISRLQSTLDIQPLALVSTLEPLEGEDLIERGGETVAVAADDRPSWDTQRD